MEKNLPMLSRALLVVILLITSRAIANASADPTATGLRAAHELAIEKYGIAAKGGDKDAQNGAYIAALNLQAANVDNLFDHNVLPLTGGERVLILNDYGFLLYRGSLFGGVDFLTHAIKILEKVTALSPNRAVAWLNLANAGEAVLEKKKVYEDTTALMGKVRAAYARYTVLTGKHAVSEARLAVLTAQAQITSIHNVCDYVATAYEQGIQDKITSDRGQVPRGGKSIVFDVEYGGSAGYPGLEELDRNGQPQSSSVPSDINFFEPYDPDGGQMPIDDGIKIVPFNGISYVVYEVGKIPDAPLYEVVRPDKGVICHFSRKYTAALSINQVPKLCKRLFEKDDLPSLPTKGINADAPQIDEGKSSKYFSWFNGTIDSYSVAYADFDGDGKTMLVGKYDGSSTAGAGWAPSGIVKMGEEISPSGSKLMYPVVSPLDRVAQLWEQFGGDDMSLVQVDGRTYVEVWGGDAYERPTPPRALMSFDGKSVKIVCRVDQQPTFINTMPDTGYRP